MAVNLIQMVNREVIIRRGRFTVPAGDPEQGPPGSGATITIFDSTANTNGVGRQIVGVPFSRLQFNIYSSHDSAASGVVFQASFDGGVTFRTQSTQTYLNANAQTTYDYLMKADHAKITYQNSASVLTAWEYTLVGILGDRNIGV